MMNIIVIMIMEKRICIAYWMKAISEPTCMSPASMRTMPKYRMASVVRFISSMIVGIMKAMMRLTLM